MPAAPVWVPAAALLHGSFQLCFLRPGATLRLSRWHQRCSRRVNLSLDALLPFPNFPLRAVGAEITTPCFSCESRNIICLLYICLLCICIFVICIIFIFVYFWVMHLCCHMQGASWSAVWIPGATHRTNSGRDEASKLLTLSWVLYSDKNLQFSGPQNGQAWSGQSEIPAAHYSENYSATVTQIFYFCQYSCNQSHSSSGLRLSHIKKRWFCVFWDFFAYFFLPWGLCNVLFQAVLYKGSGSRRHCLLPTLRTEEL